MRLIPFALLLGALAGCSSVQHEPAAIPAEALQNLQPADDLRVFYSVAESAQSINGYSAAALRLTILNESHSMYRGLREADYSKDEVILSDKNMRLLVETLAEHGRFFDPDQAEEIGATDPFVLAQSQPEIRTLIAVEIIRSGRVACFILKRPPEPSWGAPATDPKRARWMRYLDCQRVLIEFVRLSWGKARVSFERPRDFKQIQNHFRHARVKD